MSATVPPIVAMFEASIRARSTPCYLYLPYEDAEGTEVDCWKVSPWGEADADRGAFWVYSAAEARAAVRAILAARES